MNPMRGTLLPFLLLLSVTLQTQDPLQATLNAYSFPVWFENPQDTTDLMQFRSGLRIAEPATADTTTMRYRMVWCEQMREGLCTVTRGDSAALVPKPGPAI